MEDDYINQREAMEDSTTTSTAIIKEEASGPVSNGGLLDQLISTIIPTEKDATKIDLVTEEKEEEGGKGEGGILENLISNLTSPRASNPVDFEFFEANSDEQEQQQCQKVSEKNSQDLGDGGGGFIDGIVSQISENEGPTSDEASMLIHVVKD